VFLHIEFCPDLLRGHPGADEGYNPDVPRAALFALLVLTFLNGPAYAQRTAPPFLGGQGRFPNRIHSSRGSFPRGVHRRDGFGSYFLPYSEPVWDGQPEYEEVTSKQPQVVTLRTPEPPIPKGQVIEISAGANAMSAKALPPTIFILATGERLESRRFVLTANFLSVSIDRQHRTVPLDLLDIRATIAANHDRGIELQIPDDRNEISLSF